MALEELLRVEESNRDVHVTNETNRLEASEDSLSSSEDANNRTLNHCETDLKEVDVEQKGYSSLSLITLITWITL